MSSRLIPFVFMVHHQALMRICPQWKKVVGPVGTDSEQIQNPWGSKALQLV